MVKYEVQFLESAKVFLDKLDKKLRDKIIFNIWKSRETNDPQLFKKLTGNIWEFRTVFNNKQFRLFAFWDKIDNRKTLVIATHGIVKKSQKTSKNEIEKAEQLRKKYFENS